MEGSKYLICKIPFFKYSRARPKGQYPDYVKNFESKYLILNELERLVKDIDQIIG